MKQVVYQAKESCIIGDVHLGQDVSVWYHATIRADADAIFIGKGTNIQDNAVLHVDNGFPLTIGDFVTVGHGAILHGCTIGENTVIGMGAIILNHASVGKNCIIGAGTLIPQNKSIPDNSVVFGNPGKIQRKVSEDEAAHNHENALEYIMKAKKKFWSYKSGLSITLYAGIKRFSVFVLASKNSVSGKIREEIAMGKNSDWYKSKERRLNNQLQTILNEIPPFAKNYILNEITRLELKTLISYGYEIERFLDFLYQKEDKEYHSDRNTLKKMKPDVIANLTVENAKEYMQYLQDISGNTITRSVYILNNWFKYMISKGITASNPFHALKIPGIKIEDTVTHLSPEEIQEICNSVLHMDAGKSGHQEAYLKKTQLRDYTILFLILNTGIRVSECQGLDISDIDTKNNKISIVRKGGKSAVIYINQKVSDALQIYIKYRKNILTKFPDEKALFLSIQRTRMTIRAIEKLVAKLAEPCIQSKKVTPTILRNTYGVELYKKTNNQELVGTVLDCVSTSARYVQTLEEIKNTEESLP